MTNRVKAFKMLSSFLDDLICLECVEIIDPDKFKFRVVYNTVYPSGYDAESEVFFIIDVIKEEITNTRNHKKIYIND